MLREYNARFTCALAPNSSFPLDNADAIIVRPPKTGLFADLLAVIVSVKRIFELRARQSKFR